MLTIQELDPDDTDNVDPCPKGDPERQTDDDGSCHDACITPLDPDALEELEWRKVEEAEGLPERRPCLEGYRHNFRAQDRFGRGPSYCFTESDQGNGHFSCQYCGTEARVSSPHGGATGYTGRYKATKAELKTAKEMPAMHVRMVARPVAGDMGFHQHNSAALKRAQADWDRRKGLLDSWGDAVSVTTRP